MSTIRAALTQTRNVYTPMPDSVGDLNSVAPYLESIRRANVEHHIGLIEQARDRGAGVVGLGELFTAPYFALRRDPVWLGMAEDARSGPTVTSIRETAKRLEMVIVAPIYEQAADGRFNTAVVIDSDGRVCGRHRKCHIPWGTNEQGGFDERFYYQPSNGAPFAEGRSTGGNPYLGVFETGVGRLGVATCYDRHFEGVMSGLARGGAEIVFSPAVTFGEKSRRLWQMEFEVEAVRHGLFIGGSNRFGVEPPWNQHYFGESHFVGPNGRLEDRSDVSNLVISDIDLEVLRRPDPAGWDIRGDTRPEIYRAEFT